MIEKVVDRATDGVAVGGVTSPLWLPQLYEWSQIAALGLPILGCIWLLVQIVGYFINLVNKEDDEDAS